MKSALIKLSNYAGTITMPFVAFVLVSLNLYCLFVLEKSSAVYFSEEWWSQWFVVYGMITFMWVGSFFKEVIFRKSMNNVQGKCT